MKYWLVAGLVLGSLAMAQSVPLTRYFPDYALATLELNDLQGAIEKTGAFGEETIGVLSKLAGTGMEGMLEQSSKNLGAGAGLNLGVRAMLGSMRDFSIAAYNNPKQEEPDFLAVLKLGQFGPIGKMAQSTIDEIVKGSKARLREGAYVAGGESGFWLGMQSGLVYLSSNPDLLRGYLRRVQGGKQPVLWNSPAYRSVMSETGDGWLRYYLNFASIANYLNRQEPLPPKALAALRTLNLMAGAQTVTAQGIANRSSVVLNAAGGDPELYRLLTYTPERLELLSQMGGSALGAYVLAIDTPGWLAYIQGWADTLEALSPSSNPQEVEDFKAALTQLQGHVGKEWAVSTTGTNRLFDPSIWTDLENMGDPEADGAALKAFLKNLEGWTFWTTVQDGTASMDAIKQQLSGQSDMNTEDLEVAGTPALKATGPDTAFVLAAKGNTLILALNENALESALVPKQVLAELPEVQAIRWPTPLSAASFARPYRLDNSQIENLINSYLKDTELEVTPATRSIVQKWLESFYNRLQNNYSHTQVKGNRLNSYSLSGFRWGK